MKNEKLINKMKTLLGKENVLSEEADRQVYSYDSAVLPPVIPAMVIFPTSEEILGKVIKELYENNIPMTVRGAGTNLSGGTIPDNENCVVISTQKLNKILEINTQDLYAVVQPGVITASFSKEAAKKGLFYPPDPGSQTVSTIGGNIAENAGGLRGLKYGVTKDYLMAVEFFDSTGSMVKSGSKTVKCVTGYNLCGLLIQSEGTLGIISRAILKLIPPPRASRSLMAVFSEMRNAADTVSEIIANHILPSTLEFVDNSTIIRLDDFTKAGLPRNAAAILLIEVDGYPDQVNDEAKAIEKILLANKAQEIHIPENIQEKIKLWEARRQALPVLARARPTTILEDATVPRSRVPDMINAIKEIGNKYNLEIGIFGHAGDGNLHPTFLCDIHNREEFHRVEKAIDEMFEAALKLDGTLSGEHGIGKAKSKWLEKEIGKGSIVFSRRLRHALDPKGLFNSSKIVGSYE